MTEARRLRRHAVAAGLLCVAQGAALATTVAATDAPPVATDAPASPPRVLPAPGPAPTLRAPALELGVILDGSFASRALALGSREKGFGLGHTELTLGAVIDPHWAGRLTGAAHSHDGSFEAELEEAFVETNAMPAGLQARGGRFLSQVGYLNERHTHSDDFVERPLLYRAFLGSHYFDDGLRLNWVAPTALYWRTGVEVFSGNQLVQEAARKRAVGVVTLSTRVGGDLGLEHSWQAGLSYLRNNLDPLTEAHADHGDDDHAGHDHDHAHAHGASYHGRNLFLIDGVWKWAPNGNNRDRLLTVSAEYALVTDINRQADTNHRHDAGYIAAVYRFAPAWEAGARWDSLEVREPHGEHFHAARLQEASVSLAWKPSHFSVLRLQLTGQRDRGGFDAAVDNAVQVQYVMSLGAHGAHPF